MSFKYFSEVENGPPQRSAEEISPQAWGGIVVVVTAAVDVGGFGADFPATCPDGSAVCGTDKEAFSLAMQAEVPNMPWPLPTQDEDRTPFAPDTLVILDFVQFAYAHIAKQSSDEYHSFFRHDHLSFDRDKGRAAFRETINRILARNGAAFELKADGNVVRLAPPVLAESLKSPLRSSGDRRLDEMLADARNKFLSPDPKLRKESLERLWDAWERLKTLEKPADKKQSVKILLDKAATEPEMRKRLEADAQELTNIGNSFMIRHTETNKVPIEDVAQLDYLFHRMFSLVTLLLKSK
jgi:hypothetical protein